MHRQCASCVSREVSVSHYRRQARRDGPGAPVARPCLASLRPCTAAVTRHAAPWRAQGCGTDGAAPWKPDTTYLRNYISRPGKCSVDVFVWSRCLLARIARFHGYSTNVFVWSTFVLGRCYARSTTFVRTRCLYGRVLFCSCFLISLGFQRIGVQLHQTSVGESHGI